MTEQMSHIFQYTFQFLLHSDNFCNRYICLLLHCTNSLIHLRVVLSSDKTVNWYTCKSFDWFLRDRNTDLDLPFQGNVPFIYPFPENVRKALWSSQGGILKFSQCIEMTNWSEMGNMRWSFNHQCPSQTETSQLICSTNQLTGFYMRGTLVVKELKY